MTDIVTFGESMVLFQPFQGEALRYAPLFSRTIAGAESNVAIALSRLGKKVRWVSSLGEDPFGDLILSTLAGEGVDVSCVKRDADAPTAVFFKDYRPLVPDPTVHYYRQGSAASRLSPNDCTERWFSHAKHLHVTGITPALSDSAYDLTLVAMKRARERGMTISLDPNIRRKLWAEEEARQKLKSLIPYCDYFLPGRDELEFIYGVDDLGVLAHHVLSQGPKLLAIKLGAKGSIGYTERGCVQVDGIVVERVVDTVGAGDAYAAGLLSTMIDHYAHLQDNDLIPTMEQLQEMLHVANVMGAFAVQFRGDWEGLPTEVELSRFLSGTSTVTR